MLWLNGREEGKEEKNSLSYDWNTEESADRDITTTTMEYISTLLNNETCLHMGILEHKDGLRELIEKFCRASGTLPDGIFSFRFLSFFYDNADGERDVPHSWSSYVIDLDEDRI